MLGQHIKRIIDVALALVGCLLLWPLGVLVAIAIRIDTPGPTFFRQKRLGRDRVPFEIVKFRTMTDRKVIDQHDEPILVSGADDRITRVGRFLRLSSLDELPQLINVLRGDMSLVGPRPILPEQLEVVPESKFERFAVRPGITGLAQVRGRRSLDWMKQLEYDVEYSRRAGPIVDLIIMLRTLFVVFTGSGVYAGSSRNWRTYRSQGMGSPTTGSEE